MFSHDETIQWRSKERKAKKWKGNSVIIMRDSFMNERVVHSTAYAREKFSIWKIQNNFCGSWVSSVQAEPKVEPE